MSLHKAKVHEEGDGHFTVSHGGGEPFKIAKKGLSPSTIKKIQDHHLAQSLDLGGYAEEPPPDPMGLYGKGDTMGYVSPPDEVQQPGLGARLKSAAGSVGNAIAGGVKKYVGEPLETAASYWDETLAGKAPAPPEQKYSQEVAQLQADTAARSVAGGEAPAAISARAPQEQGIGGSGETEPTPVKKKTGGVPGWNPEADVVEAGKMASEAAVAKAKLAEARGNVEAEATEAHGKRLQDAAAATQARFASYQQRADDLAEKIANSQVDPNRFYTSRSTAQTVAGSIAMVLGGLGSGMTMGRQGNMAAAFFDKAVDRDIEAQKMDLDNKKSLVAHYMQAGHSIMEAGELAKADLKDYMASQQVAMAAKFAGTEAAVAAQQNLAAIKEGTAKTRMDIREKKLVMQKNQMELDMMRAAAARAPLIQGIGQHLENGNVVPETIRGPDGKAIQTGALVDPKRRVKVPGGWVYAKDDGDSMKEISKTEEALANMRSAAKRVEDLSNTMGAGGSDTQEGQLAVIDLQNAYQAMLGRSNAPRGPQEKDLSDALSNPTAFWKMSGGIKKQMALIKKVAMQRAAASYGAHLVGGMKAAQGFLTQE